MSFEPLQRLAGKRFSRAAAWAVVSAAAVLAALAMAGRAGASGHVVIGNESFPTIVGAPAKVAGDTLGQAAQQVSQVAQGAGAVATTVQHAPANISLPTAVSSPGSATTVHQANETQAGAGATNSAASSQAAGHAPGQGAQAAGTVQAAGAFATAVQVAPINIAVPIVFASPGATTSIVQINSAATGALASNTSGVRQVMGQLLGGVGGGSAQPSVATLAPTDPATVSPIASVMQAGSAVVINLVLNWTWNWNVGLRSLGWTRAPARRPAATPPARPADRSSAAPMSHLQLLEPRRNADSSSSFVQSSATAPRDWLFAPAWGGDSAPGGSAGGVQFSPLALGIGALLALGFQLLSAAGLLSRRADLATVAWRQQAYLSPLEPPG